MELQLEVGQISSDRRFLRSLAAFAAQAVIVRFGAASTHAEPTARTIQTAEQQHITLTPPPLEFTNHSCSPNAYLDVAKWELTALRPIAAGDEITIFYPSTEWEMATPFPCWCGSPRCLGEVTGARQLPVAALDGYDLAPHIVRLLARAAATSKPLDVHAP